MTAEDRRERILMTVRSLLSQEEDLVQAMTRRGDLVKEPDRARTLVESLHDQSRAHCEALRRYLDETGARAPEMRSGVPEVRRAEGQSALPDSASLVLQDLFVQLNSLAIGYTALHTMAMRLFEPPLRELAPDHLRRHAAAVQEIAVVLPQVVATELAGAGLTCACPCPMCSIGICGCVAGATATVTDAWRETAPQPAPQPGFFLQAPRAGSQLAGFAIPGGAHLASVNGERMTEHHPYEVFTAISACKPGEDIRLQVLVGDESREIVVRRADAVAG